jgi:hypothetical protein
MALSQHETDVLRELERQFAGPHASGLKRRGLVIAIGMSACILLAGGVLALLAVWTTSGVGVVAGVIVGVLLGQLLRGSSQVQRLRGAHWRSRMSHWVR